MITQHNRETHNFWRILREIPDPEKRPFESPASEKLTKHVS